MIEINPDYFIAVCFIIFVYLIYRPAKLYINTFLDKNIADLQKNINEAKTIVSDTKNLLNETKNLIENFHSYKDFRIVENDLINEQVLNSKKIEYEQILKHKKVNLLSQVSLQKKLISKKINSDYIDAAINIARIYCIQTNNNQISDVDIAKILQNIANS